MKQVIRLTVAINLALFFSFVSMTGVKAAAAGKIVVANRASQSISIIDVKTDFEASVSLPTGINPPEPMYVVYSPIKQRVFVGDRANNRVVVFDARDFSVETTVPTGSGVFHMWASTSTSQLWVNNDLDKTASVIDTATLDVLATVDMPADAIAMGGKPHDVIHDPTAPFAYVTIVGLPGASDYVIKFSTQTFTEVGRAAVGKDPHLSLSTKGDLLYVPCQNSDSVFVLNRDTMEEVTIITVPGAHGAGMAKNGRTFYSTNLPGGGTDGLITIDTTTKSITSMVDTPFPVPHNIAITPNGKKIYITHSGATASSVSVFQVTAPGGTPHYLTDVVTGLNPFGLTFVP